jgi:hypothetical protein
MDLSIIKKAIGNFRAIHGRTPNAAEMAELEKQAMRFAQPTSGLRSGASAQPRAAYELGTDPNLINPDTARDEFLTKMTTGRTTKGTNLRPITQDVSDPSVVKNIETQQMGGQLDNAIPDATMGSTTPSADYFANTARGIENEAISGKALDDLKQAFEDFVAKNGRQPEQDELSEIIAQYNPARHQYGEQGIGIMSQRPPTAKGMTDWRNAARNEGVEESYLTKRQGNYPQYIQDEMQIQRGELPATAMKEKKKRYKEVAPVDFYIDENGNAVKVYPTMKAEGGQITPRDMLAQMIVNQVTPQKFKKGGVTAEEFRKLQNESNQQQQDYINEYTNVANMLEKDDMEKAMAAPSFKAQPFSVMQAIRNKLAPTIGDKNVDKIFGGPQANLPSIAIQALNPATYGVGYADSMTEAAKAAKQGDGVTAGVNYGIGALNLVPFAGKGLTAAQKMKQVVNPATNKLGIGLTGVPYIYDKIKE